MPSPDGLLEAYPEAEGAALTAPPQPIAGRAIYRTLLLRLDQAVGFVLFVQLAVIVLVVLGGVISRYAFNSSFSWTEELASWTLIALTFTGMAAGHNANRHITVDLLGPFGLSHSAEAARLFIVDVVVSLSMIMLLVGGLGILDQIHGKSVALAWDVRIKVAIIPIACVLGFAFMMLTKLCAGRTWLASIMPIAVAGVLYGISTTLDAPLAGFNASLIMGLTFFIAVFIGVPVAFSLLFASFLPGWGGNLLPIAGVVSIVVDGASAFVILAIPFFLAASYFMNSGGMSQRLIDFSYSLTGHFRGGLAQANIFHSLLLGGISGSSTADAASTTKILVPIMIKRGYSPDFACASTAVGALLPAIIPPSIALLIYASVANISVAQIFMAGVGPGVLMCGVMMVVVKIISERRKYEKLPQMASVREMLRTGAGAFPALFLAIIILGLLRIGVMTATEVGVVAVIWALGCGLFLHREMTWGDFYRDARECALDVGIIVFLVSVSHPGSWLLLAEQLPQDLVAWLIPLIDHKWQLFLLVNAAAFIAGCLLEVVPSILILAPILGPLFVAMGVDPIHGGIIIMLNVILATVMPPVGIVVYVCASIARIQPAPIFRECMPFVVACYAVLLLVTFVPDVSLGLWKLIGQ